MMKLYVEASRIINLLNAKKGSIKNLVFSSEYKNKKQLFALVCETLKYGEVIGDMLDRTKLLDHERALDRDATLARVLVYDLIFGHGVQHAAKKHRDAVVSHKTALSSALSRLKVQRKVSKNKDLLKDNSVFLPRYARVNLLKTNMADVIRRLKSEGYSEVNANDLDYDSYVEAMRSMQPGQMMRDAQLPDLIVFAPATDLHRHVLYTLGELILQDKASCVPAHVLAAPPGGQVIDCCAAPGNKTTHVAALMANSGRIYAFDKSAERVRSLREMTRKAGVTCVTLAHQDFLTVGVTDGRYGDVQYAIVDPSCSGSGIVGRLDSLTDGASEAASSSERLDRLAEFQTRLLSRVMSFPSMHRVVYSTCSLSERENEAVVAAAMLEVPGYALVEVMPGLPGRGQGALRACLRLAPERDLTNGFFVARLERAATLRKREEGTTQTVATSEGSSRKAKGRKARKRKTCAENYGGRESVGQNGGTSVTQSGATVRSEQPLATKQKKRQKRRVLRPVTTQ